MKILNTDGASTVKHGVHGEFRADADGYFEVPPELAVELLGFPHWTTEDVHLAETHKVDLADLHDPTVVAAALAGLYEDAAILSAGGTLEEPYAGRWEPDARTLAWCAAHVQNNTAAVAEWSALVVEIDALQRTAQAAAEQPVEATK